MGQRYRLVPYSTSDDNPQIRVHYLPSYTITSESDTIPIDDKDDMAIIYHTMYLLLSMSDNPSEANRSGRFYAMYRKYIEGRHEVDETGKSNLTRMNTEFL